MLYSRLFTLLVVCVLLDFLWIVSVRCYFVLVVIASCFVALFVDSLLVCVFSCFCLYSWMLRFWIGVVFLWWLCGLVLTLLLEFGFCCSLDVLLAGSCSLLILLVVCFVVYCLVSWGCGC